MTKTTSFFFGFSSLLFLLFAYWQWNDSDPEIWVSIYGLTAILCAFAAFGRYFTSIAIVAAIAALLGGLYYFPSSVGDWVFQEWQQKDLSMKTIDMEEARESFGLLIVSLMMCLIVIFDKRKKTKNKPRFVKEN